MPIAENQAGVLGKTERPKPKTCLSRLSWGQQWLATRGTSAGGFEVGRTSRRIVDDYCSIEDHDFFVRGNIHLPIIGTAETLRWGVWGSLSREHFEQLMRTNDGPKHDELRPVFSWLSNRIREYPDTLKLKMYAHIQNIDSRPSFELELTSHPLSQEYHHGITAERVKEIMLGRLSDNNKATR